MDECHKLLNCNEIHLQVKTNRHISSLGSGGVKLVGADLLHGTVQVFHISTNNNYRLTIDAFFFIIVHWSA